MAPISDLNWKKPLLLESTSVLDAHKMNTLASKANAAVSASAQ
jgi:hypothetical protein